MNSPLFFVWTLNWHWSFTWRWLPGVGFEPQQDSFNVAAENIHTMEAHCSFKDRDGGTAVCQTQQNEAIEMVQIVARRDCPNFKLWLRILREIGVTESNRK